MPPQAPPPQAQCVTVRGYSSVGPWLFVCWSVAIRLLVRGYPSVGPWLSVRGQSCCNSVGQSCCNSVGQSCCTSVGQWLLAPARCHGHSVHSGRFGTFWHKTPIKPHGLGQSGRFWPAVDQRQISVNYGKCGYPGTPGGTPPVGSPVPHAAVHSVGSNGWVPSECHCSACEPSRFYGTDGQTRCGLHGLTDWTPRADSD